MANHFFNWNSLHARLNNHYEAWSYKKKKKNIKIIEENYLERTQGKKRLLTLDLKPFRSHFKEKHPTGKEFQSLGVR